MNIANSTKVLFERNRLILQDSTTHEEWKELGKNLKTVEGSVQFWIGDWARFGDKQGFSNYTDPKVYDQIEEITGLDRDTIKDYKSVAERTSSVRTHDLDYSHYRVVASLPEEKQREFLDRAVTEKLSVRELKDEVKKDKQEDSPVIKLTQSDKDKQREQDLIWAEDIISQVNEKPTLIRLKIKEAIRK